MARRSIRMVDRWYGMKGFYLIWFGQFASILGSRITAFALTVAAWDLTNSATTLALVAFFTYGSTALLSPFAGIVVDRYNRKLVMAVSDLIAAMASGLLLMAVLLNGLQVWHFYLVGFLNGVSSAFQYPAYAAAMTMLVPKDQLARSNGIKQMVNSASGILAPLLAGILLALLGLSGVLLIDLCTFGMALGCLLVVAIPHPARTAQTSVQKSSFIEKTLFGFKYIFQRSSLAGLQGIMFLANIATAFSITLLRPMVLAKSGNSAVLLGYVLSAYAAGSLAGGLTMGFGKGWKSHMHVLLIGLILWGVTGMMFMGLSGGFIFQWIAAFFLGFYIPMINASEMSILQAKVAPDVQGRVFGASNLLSTITLPIGQVLAGTLADTIFEPAMSSQTILAGTFGTIVGTGPGAGMSVIFLLAGMFCVLVGVVGLSINVTRDLETLLPDHIESTV